jgi:hypothetical protein
VSGARCGDRPAAGGNLLSLALPRNFSAAGKEQAKLGHPSCSSRGLSWCHRSRPVAWAATLGQSRELDKDLLLDRPTQDFSGSHRGPLECWPRACAEQEASGGARRSAIEQITVQLSRSLPDQRGESASEAHEGQRDEGKQFEGETFFAEPTSLIPTLRNAEAAACR